MKIKLKNGEILSGTFTDTSHRIKCAVNFRHWRPEEKEMSSFLAKSNGMNAYVKGKFLAEDGKEYPAVRLARPDECTECAQIKKHYIASWKAACEQCIEV
jgi:hypothetical protein